MQQRLQKHGRGRDLQIDGAIRASVFVPNICKSDALNLSQKSHLPFAVIMYLPTDFSSFRNYQKIYDQTIFKKKKKAMKKPADPRALIIYEKKKKKENP